MKILQILVLIFGLAIFVNTQDKEKLFVLSGTVYDVQKAVVPATEVTAENKDRRTFHTTSDENGVFKISIPFGEYTFVFHKDGYKITKIINFENQTSLEKTIVVNLEVGQCYDCNGDIYGEDNSDKRKPKEIEISNTNVLSGIVTDHLGAIIPQANIKDIGNNKTFTAETDEKGLYKLNLPEGIYTVEFAASGHKTYKIKEYRKTFQAMSLDVALYAIPTPII